MLAYIASRFRDFGAIYAVSLCHAYLPITVGHLAIFLTISTAGRHAPAFRYATAVHHFVPGAYAMIAPHRNMTRARL